MKTQEKSPKFKVGQRVWCSDNGLEEASSTRGWGWKKRLSFKVTQITNAPSGEFVYWEGKNTNGVFESFLQDYPPSTGDPIKDAILEAVDFIKGENDQV
jgi:hypothetical protein